MKWIAWSFAVLFTCSETYPALAQTAGYKGSKFAYVAPGWKGELPVDVKRIDAPTPWILIQPRVHMPNPGELTTTAAKRVIGGLLAEMFPRFA